MLPLGAALGWYIARRWPRPQEQGDHASPEYLTGLAQQGIFLQPSLENLMALYEQARDWRQAIEVARQLQAVKSASLRPLIAQYYCELSEEARARKDPAEALRLAGRALSEHAECV